MARIVFGLMAIGLLTMIAAFPVSMYFNGDEIWTHAGMVAGNRCMMWGSVMMLAGGALTVLSALFNRD